LDWEPEGEGIAVPNNLVLSVPNCKPSAAGAFGSS